MYNNAYGIFEGPGNSWRRFACHVYVEADLQANFDGNLLQICSIDARFNWAFKRKCVTKCTVSIDKTE